MWRWLTAALIVLAAGLSLGLGTYANDQPMRYHADEPSKVAQLLSGQWNFHHPQALLTTTRWVTQLIGPALPVDGGASAQEADRERIAQRGRLVSALFAALATVSLGLMAWVLAGRRAGVAVAFLVAVCPPLVLRAHYMKEDAALVAGLAVIGLGLALVQQRWRWAGALVLGLGCGLAAAGKYVGIVPAVVSAVLPLMMSGAGRWWQRPAVVLLGAAVGAGVWLGLNHEILGAAEQFSAGWTKEWEHALEDGHRGLYPPAWGTFFLDAIQYEVPWPVLGAAAAGLGWFLWRGRRSGVAAWAVAVFPLAYYALLMPSTIGFGRYALPIMVGLTVLAGWAVAAWPARMRRRPRLAVTGTLLIALLIPSAARTAIYLQGFTHDSRDRLLAWVLTELPPGSVLAQEGYAALRHRDLWPARIRLRSSTTPMSAPSLEHLRRRGVTHVAIASTQYFRYLDGHLRPNPDQEQHVAHIQANYARLFAEGRLLWQSEAGRGIPGFTNPVIRVYDIRRD